MQRRKNEELTRWNNPVRLGKGTFSEVYRVTDRSTGELLVCKVSSRLSVAVREAKLLKQIRHPLFPAYKGELEAAGKHYLFMEYICGCELGRYVARRGCLSQERAVEIVLELAEGLNYLHECQEPVVFRDIKPENVMIAQDGRVRLVDLGCACAAKDSGESMAGTRGYAAPEQFQEGKRLGRECDVYALGRLLDYMLRGQRRASEGLVRLLQRAVAVEPMERIPDMRTFMLLLEPFAQKRSRWQRLRPGKGGWNSGRSDSTDFYYKKNIRKG